MNKEIIKHFKNVCMMSDSYKHTHWKVIKPGTTKIYAYLESRGGEFDETLFSGLSFYTQLLEGPVLTQEFIDFAVWFCDIHFGYRVINKESWEKCLEKHKGIIPIKIMAVPEGTIVANKNVLATFENTDDEFPWISQFFESLFLKVWYPITVGTYSFRCCQLIKEWQLKTGTKTIPEPFYHLHDFGYRGVSSEESAGIGGMSHLLNSIGTDNLMGVLYAMAYYDAKPSDSFSVLATEHSVATPYGLTDEGEKEYILKVLEKIPNDKIASIVGDSKDIYNFAWLLGNDHEISEKIRARTAPFVIRPDSGDPNEVLPKILNILWDSFGGTYQDGFKILNPCIRILQGDGINYNSINNICKVLSANKFAVENLIFGSGGKLLQAHDRDEYNFAIKCSYSIINGEEVNVLKNPITSPGKKSKEGRLKLIPTGHGFQTISSKDMTEANFNAHINILEEVFIDGVVKKTYTLNEIKSNIERTKKFYGYI